MRLLFLADGVSEDLPGGSKVAARELATGLISRGHEVTFLVGRQAQNTSDDEHLPDGRRIIRYEGAGQGLSIIKNGQIACRKLWNQRPFDLVHTHFAFSAIGPLKEIPKSIPHVRTFHGPWDEEVAVDDSLKARTISGRITASARLAYCRMVETSNLRSSDSIITLSQYFGRKVTERYGVPKKRLTVIPGGADLDRFKPPIDKATIRKNLGLPLDRQILLSVRRLEQRMGLHNLIAAMPKVVAENPNVLLIIGGKGSQQARLEQLINKYHLNNHVYLEGFISDAALASYYQAADLFVLPTIALEGFGLVTAEALASGLPVLGTPVGATPEILSGISDKLITRGCQPDDLAYAITGLLKNGLENEFRADSLRKHIVEHYNWDRHVSSVEAIYLRLTESRENKPIGVCAESY